MIDPNPNAKNLSLILDRDFADVDTKIFPGARVLNGDKVADRIKSVSGEGKSPIASLVITGHSGRGLNKITGTTTAFIFFSRKGSFHLQDLLNMDQPISYYRAKRKRGPLRCWFTRHEYRYLLRAVLKLLLKTLHPEFCAKEQSQRGPIKQLV